MKGTRSFKHENVSLDSFCHLFLPGRFLIPYLAVHVMKLQRIRKTRYPKRETPNPTRTVTIFWLNFMIGPHGLTS